LNWDGKTSLPSNILNIIKVGTSGGCFFRLNLVVQGWHYSIVGPEFFLGSETFGDTEVTVAEVTTTYGARYARIETGTVTLYVALDLYNTMLNNGWSLKDFYLMGKLLDTTGFEQMEIVRGSSLLFSEIRGTNPQPIIPGALSLGIGLNEDIWGYQVFSYDNKGHTGFFIEYYVNGKLVSSLQIPGTWNVFDFFDQAIANRPGDARMSIFWWPK
jgi:hypothetical protein